MDFLKLKATLGLDDSEYQKGLSNASSMAKKIGGGIAKGVGVAVTAATGAMTAFGKSAIDAGLTFDSSMSQVAATMGKTMSEMQNEVGSVDLAWGHFSGNLRDYAQEMGRNTAFSATQAADALNYMALAGYDTQTSMQMLPNVLNLAAAGGMDLARASDMVTDTQTAFGISLDRTSQMVDEMAKAASTGNTSVEQLGDAFLVVGGLAQELNGGMVKLKDGTTKSVDGIQEMEIAMTAMANAGIKGSEAGTHMRNMILKLSNPTDAGTKALERMGVTIFDKTTGAMRSLADIIGDLNGKMSEMTQEDRIQTISALFNTRDLSSAEALLKAVGQDWNEIGEAILNAQGAAQKMADTQLDNLAGDVTLFKSALEGARIAVSDSMTPALRDFVKFGTDGLSRMTAAFKEGGITGAMEEFGSILSDGLNMIIEKLPQFVDAGMKLLGALGQGLLDNLPEIMTAAEKILVTLVEGIVEAAPHLAEGAIQIIEDLGHFLRDSLPTLIPSVVDMLLSIVEIISDNIDIILEAAVNIVVGLAEGIINSIPKLVEKVPKIITGLVEGLTKAAPEIVEAAPEIMIQLAAGLIKAIPELVKAVPEIIDAIAKAFNPVNLAKGMADAGKNFWKTFGDIVFNGGEKLDTSNADVTLGEALQTLWSDLKEKFTKFGKDSGAADWFAPISDGFKQWVENRKEDLELIGEWFEDLKTAFSDKITEIAENVSEKWNEITEPIREAWNSLMEWLSPVLDAFSALFEAVWVAIQVIATETWTNIKTFFEETWNGIKTFFEEIWNGIVEFFIPITQSIHDKVVEIWDAIKTKTEEVWNSIKEFFEGIWNGIVEFFEPIVDGIRDKVSEVWENIYTSISDWMTQVHDDLLDAWTNIKTDIDEALSNLWDIISGWFTNIVDSALDWGRDMIGNFIDGITQKRDDLVNAVTDAAGAVSERWHFSKPDKGPLSEADKWMPDMMRLFAQGIKDNTNIVEDQLNDSLDFSDNIISAPNTPVVDTSKLIATTGSASGTGTAILEIDHVQFAKLIYNLYNNEDQRMGVRLANV